MVELLRAHDPEVVSQIEMSMYDFFILSNQSEVTITRIIEEVPLEQWAVALKGAEWPCATPSWTDAEAPGPGFEDMMRRAGPVPMSRIEQTRREIMATVKDAGRQRRNRSPAVRRGGGRMKQFRPYHFPPLAQFTWLAHQRAAAQSHSHSGEDGQWARGRGL
jgi:hypothetical protein